MSPVWALLAGLAALVTATPISSQPSQHLVCRVDGYAGCRPGPGEMTKLCVGAGRKDPTTLLQIDPEHGDVSINGLHGFLGDRTALYATGGTGIVWKFGLIALTDIRMSKAADGRLTATLFNAEGGLDFLCTNE